MSAIEVPAELLAEARNYIDRTWDDPEDDARLLGQLRSGIAFITQKTGVDASVFYGPDVDNRAQALLFNYLLYDRAGALHQFRQNYRDELIALRVRTEVRHAAESRD